jgi:flagellar biosynthesis chaperone FliJ
MAAEDFNQALMEHSTRIGKILAAEMVRSMQPFIDSLKAAIDTARQQMSRRVGYGRAKLYRHPKRRALRK